jgi:hypothetical protein
LVDFCNLLLRLNFCYAKNKTGVIEMISLLIFLFIMLSCSASGARLCGIKKQNIGNLVLSGCMGLFIISYTVLFIGLAGWLYKWVFIGILSLFFISFRKESFEIFYYLISISRNVTRIWPRKRHWFLLVIYIFILATTCIRALAPEIGNDALAYHLAHPKVFVDLHSIVAIPYTRESLWPYFTEMLFTLGLLLQGAVLAKLFSFVSAVMLSLAVYSFAKEKYGRDIGLFSCIIFFSTPAIFTQAGYAYIDIMLALYSFMSLFFLFKWLDFGKYRNIFLSGLFCGACLSIKYLGLFIFIAISSIFLFQLFVARDKRLLLKSYAVFSFVVFFVSAIWYLRSYLITGNPVYPFLHQYFKNGWNEAASILTGTGKNLISFILVPWRITMYPQFFDGEQVGGIYLLLLPFILLSRCIKDIKIQAIMVFVFVYSLLWFLSSQILRFLFPVLPLLAIFSSLALFNILKNIKIRYFTLIVFSGFLIFNTFISIYHTKNCLKVVIGLEKEGEYLSKRERSYVMAEYINRNIAKTSKILSFEPRIFYINRNVIYSGSYLEEENLKYAGLGDLVKVLKKNGFDYVLLMQIKPFTEDFCLSEKNAHVVHKLDFIENTYEDRRYILIKL